MHRVTRLFLAYVLLSSTVACKTTVQAPTEAPALGSDAKIVVKKNKTGTFTVNVDLMNLAPAPRLDADATAFVVWLVADDQPAVRAGALAYDEGARRRAGRHRSRGLLAGAGADAAEVAEVRLTSTPAL